MSIKNNFTFFDISQLKQFDGVHWITSAYDLDATWGLSWDGKTLESGEDLKLFMIDRDYYKLFYQTKEYTNVLWDRLYKNFYQEVKQRYVELRQTVLSLENINQKFGEFFDRIPNALYVSESQKYTQVPNQEHNNFQQIRR